VSIYHPAPLPPGRTIVTGSPPGLHAGHLYLTFQHGGFFKSCGAMATKLDFPLYCPDLLPTDATISGAGCCIFSNPNVAPLFVLDSHFTATEGYRGAVQVPVALGTSKIPHGHLLLIAARRTAQSSALSCASPQPAGNGPDVHNLPSFFQLCPGELGGNAHHLILTWEDQGIDYSISLHGDTKDNRLALELMTLNLYLIFPDTF